MCGKDRAGSKYVQHTWIKTMFQYKSRQIKKTVFDNFTCYKI